MRHYEAMANRAVTAEQRLGFDARAVKAMNNYVKACILDVTIRSVGPAVVDVADIACGRGQDFAKWMFACQVAKKTIGSFYAMDLAKLDVTQMVDKYIRPVAAEVHVAVGDMSRRFEGIPDTSLDVLSCQLAIHYLFEKEDLIKGFLAECSRVLKPAGVLLLSYVDGRSVVRRVRDAIAREPSPDYVIDVRRKHYSIKINSMLAKRFIESPYGCEYVFSISDCIEGVPEYLCHEGVLRTLAKAEGFYTGCSMYFDEAVAHFFTIPYLQTIAVKMKYIGMDDPHAYETANLYRFSVLSKSVTSLKKWDLTLSDGPATTERRHPSSLRC